MSRIHKAKSVDGISSNFIIFRNSLEPDLIFLQNSINYAGVLSIEPKHLEILADSQTDRPSKLSRPAEAVLLNRFAEFPNQQKTLAKMNRLVNVRRHLVQFIGYFYPVLLRSSSKL